MKLLILTQKIDRYDDVLGFMHGWVAEFAKHCEQIIVIALGVGEHHLPNNVKVFSLGKERGSSRLKYLARFFRYIAQERNNYDAVFVHMNQEYAILGGLLWRLWGKRVAMWRNHQRGGLGARVAVLFSHLVFCTSKFAFVARYKKNQIMPVGVDTELFQPDALANKALGSVLFFSRISPIKRLDLLVDALNILKERRVDFTAKIVGDAPARDAAYLGQNKQKVEALGLADKVEFKKGASHRQAPAVYRQSEVFVNLTNSGSLDKTTMEAMACGGLVLVSNRVFEDIFSSEQKNWLMFQEGKAGDLAEKLQRLFGLDAELKKKLADQGREIIGSRHSLKALAVELFKVLATEKQ